MPKKPKDRLYSWEYDTENNRFRHYQIKHIPDHWIFLFQCGHTFHYLEDYFTVEVERTCSHFLDHQTINLPMAILYHNNQFLYEILRFFYLCKIAKIFKDNGVVFFYRHDYEYNCDHWQGRSPNTIAPPRQRASDLCNSCSHKAVDYDLPLCVPTLWKISKNHDLGRKEKPLDLGNGMGIFT